MITSLTRNGGMKCGPPWMIPAPKIGDVFIVDLGIAGKVRPVVILSREDNHAPRALAIAVPLTLENRGSPYEVPMPCVTW
ncbi:MAG: type II toxin-antitoxin system PemK/MazF family toxin [Verrucomicrobiota bacterium]